MGLVVEKTTKGDVTYKNVKLSDLGTNDSVTMKLKYDEPKSGEGKFGTWYVYNVEMLEPNLGEVSFFSAKMLHYDLSKYKAGTVLKVTCTPKTNKSGKTYKGFTVEPVLPQTATDDELAVIINEFNSNEELKNSTEEQIRTSLFTLGIKREEDIQTVLTGIGK